MGSIVSRPWTNTLCLGGKETLRIQRRLRAERSAGQLPEGASSRFPLVSGRVGL